MSCKRRRFRDRIKSAAADWCGGGIPIYATSHRPGVILWNYEIRDSLAAFVGGAWRREKAMMEDDEFALSRATQEMSLADFPTLPSIWFYRTRNTKP